MKIYLIRHAQKRKTFSRNWRKIAITEKGEKQAEYFGQFAKDLKIKKIFTSDYKRTKQTAEIIGNVLGVKPERSELIREVDPVRYVYYIFRSLFPNYSRKYKQTFLSDMKELYGNNGVNVLLSTHAGYVRFIASLFTKNRLERLRILVRMYFNLGLTVLEMKDGVLKIEKFNNVDFLPCELRTKFPL